MCYQQIKTHKKVNSVISVVLVLLGLSCYFGLNALIKYEIKKKLVLSEGSYAYDMWKDIPFPIEYSIYMFNLTNPWAFEHDNAQPVLEEIGPYVFNEHRHKENITFHSNGTVSYQQRRTYDWVPEKMNNVSEGDTIVFINMLVAAAVKMIKITPEIIPEDLRPYVSGILNNLPLLSNQTAGALLLTGWQDPFIDVAHEILPNFTIPKFALIGNRNDTTFDGSYNVFTGASNINKLGFVDRWKFKNNIGHYRPNSVCDGFNYSSAGEFRPPFLMKDNSDPVYIFSTDMCRSFRMDYQEESEVHGIKTKRYISDKHEFDYELEENKCFCQSDQTCPVKGVSNISSCFFDAPVFISFPHFLHGSDELVNAFKGLHPDEEKNQFYMDYEPTLGLPLAGSARAQMNVLVEKDPNVKALSKLKHDKTYWPLVWMSIRVEMPEDLVSKVKFIVTWAPLIIIVISLVLLVSGICLISTIFYFKCRENSRDFSIKAK